MVVALTVPPPGVLVTRTVDGTRVFEVFKLGMAIERTLEVVVLFCARTRLLIPIMQSRSCRKDIVAIMVENRCLAERTTGARLLSFYKLKPPL